MTNVLEDRTMCESQKACAEACPMRCATSPIDEVAHIAHVLATQGRFGLTRGFIQHGTMSVHAHMISVAHASLAMAGRLAKRGSPVFHARTRSRLRSRHVMLCAILPTLRIKSRNSFV